MKASLKKQLQSVASVSPDRIYYDIPDELADAMFSLYDPADLYMYLTTRERNLAYKDMQGIGANSKQVQYEWMKKAIWRIAQKKAWDELEELEEDVNMNGVNEAQSSYLKRAKQAKKLAYELVSSANFLIGATGSGEVSDILAESLSAAALLMEFAKDVLVQVDDEYSDDSRVKKAIQHCAAAQSKLNLLESQQVQAEPITESSEIYIDPYEAEYLPAELLSNVAPEITEEVVDAPATEASVTGDTASAEITESVVEDADLLPDDLDDDPDAMFTIDTSGMPTKFNNTPMDLDPFAVRLFRNNSELIDPPEVFQAVADADKTVEPEIDPGTASDATVDDAAREDVIDVIADGEDKEKEESIASVVLPSNDFENFAEESTVVTHVTPKVAEEKEEKDILPSQFEFANAKSANSCIADEPGNNLRMLSYLLGADI